MSVQAPAAPKSAQVALPPGITIDSTVKDPRRKAAYHAPVFNLKIPSWHLKDQNFHNEVVFVQRIDRNAAQPLVLVSGFPVAMPESELRQAFLTCGVIVKKSRIFKDA